MVSLWCILLGMVLTFDEQIEKRNDDVLAMIGKNYVAYFEIWSKTEYYKNWLDKIPESETEQWWHSDTDRAAWIGDMIDRIELLSIPKMADKTDYKSEKLPRKLLYFDVYLIYPPNSVSAPYKLGIMESNFRDPEGRLDLDGLFRFFRFNGFSDIIRFPDDSSQSESYNESLDFLRLNHLTEYNSYSIDEFVADWIQLIQYEGHPRDFELLSNEYKLTEDRLAGRCRTLELDRRPGQNPVSVQREWTYEISRSNDPILKETSLESE